MAGLLIGLANVLTPIIGGAAAGAIVGGIGYLVGLAPLLLLNLITSRLFAPKIPDAIESLKGISYMSRSAVEYRKVVYGQAAVSGPLIYNNVEGTNGRYLWHVIALCEGEIEDLVSVRLDRDAIPKADINWTAGTGGADGSGTGEVSTAAFLGSSSTKAVNVYYTLGHPDQVAIGALDSAFADWTSTCRARGVALLATRFLYDEDTAEVWEKGVPSNIRAVVKGRKIYDPRLDSTQVIDDTTSPLTYGSGTHRTSDSSTWAWSDNPALCVADYLLNFMGVAAGSIDWPALADAADDCDVQVLVPPAASPSNYETRFTCNGALSLGTSHKDNLDSLLSSCDGRLSYSSGKWRMRASVWEASSVSFDEDDLAGAIDVRGSAPKSERFNAVRGIFVDPSRDYEATEFPHITNSNYLTRDNSVEIEYDLELPMTNSDTMAQRIAFRLLEQANNQVVVRITTNLRGAKVAVGDVFDLTLDKLSWTSKTFRCIEWERQSSGTFLITGREDASTDYDDPDIADYLDGDSGDVTVPADTVPPPSGLTATAVPYGIRLDWTNPAAREFDYIDVYASASSAWGSASKIGSVKTDTFAHALENGTVRYYWIRARRNSGDVSLRNPDSDTSTVTATANGTTVSGSAAVFVNQYIRSAGTPGTPGATSASYNFDSAQFTPTSTWSSSVPAQTSPTTAVWVSTAQFYSADSTGTDNNTTWSTPQKLAEDGAAGADGNDGNDGAAGAASIFVNQYIRSVGTPGTPGATSASYNFDTAQFTPTSTWSAGVPAQTSPTTPVWVSTAQFYSADGTGTDGSTTWTTPQKLAEDGVQGPQGDQGPQGNPGADGADGSAAIFVNQYIRNASTPATPGSTSASYNFDTTQFNPTATWSAGVPAADGNPVWVSTAQFYSADGTGTDSSTTWSAPQKLAEDGADGNDGATGQRARTVSIFRKNSNSISSASGTFADPLSGNTSWSYSVPALTTDGDIVYVAVRTFTDDAASPQDANWSTPAIYAQRTDGTDGADGNDGATGQRARTVTIFRKNSSTISSASGTFADPLSGNTSWSYSVPALTSNGDIVYVAVRTFTDDAASPQDAAWSTPATYAQRTDGSAGADGSDGAASIFVNQYIRSATTPATPGSTSASYNFDTAQFTPTSTWSSGVPAQTSPSTAVWVSTAQFYSADGTGTDSSTTWTTPQKLAEDGAVGASGNYRDIKFKRSASQPSTPTGDNPAGWTDGVPTGTDVLWQTTGTKNSSGTLQGVWSTPERVEGMGYRGNWASGNTYILHDVVTYSERAFICVQAHTPTATSPITTPPSTNASNSYWDLFAAKGDPGDESTFTDTISITSLPANLRDLANTAGYTGTGNATVTFNLGAGVSGSGAANGGRGIDTGVWPSGTYTISLTLNISGTVRGGGGRGGSGGDGAGGGNANSGNNGGDAIYLQESLTALTVNSGGNVLGGGGGGGGGGGAAYPSDEPIDRGGGGGGGGFPNGSGGAGGDGQSAVFDGATGSAGTTGGGGSGGGGAGSAGDGGTGGGVASNGSAGTSGTGSYLNGAGASGGSAGYAIRQNGHTITTYTNNGTVTGTKG